MIIVSDKHKTFNTCIPKIVHIDINSCFATIEQQYNKYLRNKPIGIAARNTPNGMLVATSIEAKKLGIRTGTRIKEAKSIYPPIIIIQADPPKYRYVHNKMFKLLLNYSDKVEPKSIDEFAIDMNNFPLQNGSMINLIKEIKNRIRKDVGDWISVSVGIGPNRFLAKTGAGFIKPNGLTEINSLNYKKIYSQIKLSDLNGIGTANLIKLNSANIFTTTDFYNTDLNYLRSIFKSIIADYWYMRLRGWEIDDYSTQRGSFSASYVLNKPTNEEFQIKKILIELSDKLGKNMRGKGYKSFYLILYIKYDNERSYTRFYKTKNEILTSLDISKVAIKLFDFKSTMEVRKIGITCTHLKCCKYFQLDMFNNIEKNVDLQKTIDEINKKCGSNKIKPALLLNSKNIVPDGIAFGK